MGTNHCDASTAQFKLDKSLGHICIDPVVGGTTTLNFYAGITSLVQSFGNYQHEGPFNIAKNADGNGNLTVVGNVGIGITNPTHSLDVSGSVNVSGTITNNNCTLKYWKITGTTPTMASGSGNYNLPSGCQMQMVMAI